MGRTLIDLDVQALDDSLTQSKIAPGAVADTEVAGAAAIALSKLATASDWDTSGALKENVVDAFEINASAISDTHVNASAAIAYSKLNLSLSILNADVNASAAIALSKLAAAADWDTSGALKTGVVADSEVHTSAAIAWTKMAAVSENAILVGNGSNLAAVIDTDAAGDIAASSSTGLKYKLDSIVNEDINSAAAIATSKLADGADFLQTDLSKTIGTATRYTYTGTPVFTADNDLVTKKYVDDNIAGQAWKNPALCLHLVGAASFTTLNGLGTKAGDAYIVSAAGTLTRGTLGVSIGDIVEDNGTIWVLLVAGVASKVADGVRVILSDDQPGRAATALISPYTDATDDGKIFAFDGTDLIGSDTGDATNKASLLIQDDAHAGLYDNLQYVYEGTVPAGQWIQTNGAANITAGQGLTKATNTINAGDAGKGIQVNADDFEFDASESAFATGGLEASSNSWQLQINLEASNPSLQIDGSNQLGVKISTGLEKVAAGLRMTSTGVSASSYGSATQVPGFTVDAQGRLTTAANVAIQLASSAAVTGLDTALGLKADESLWTGKGVIVGASGAGAPLGLAAGTDGYTLVSDAASGAGIKWVATTAGQTADREVPNEWPNNSRTEFTVDTAPIAGTEHVWLNGVLQDDGGEDYLLSGATITFIAAPKGDGAGAGDKIRVSYRY